jgi:hypothetical protein
MVGVGRGISSRIGRIHNGRFRGLVGQCNYEVREIAGVVFDGKAQQKDLLYYTYGSRVFVP